MSTPLPFATAGLPGSGGRLKASPEDFLVEELPAYLREGINVHFARTFREVFECVFQDHQVDKSLH